jgi:hypothetical protein
MPWGERSNRPGLLLPLAVCEEGERGKWKVHQLLGNKGKEVGKWKEGRWLVDEGERDR